MAMSLPQGEGDDEVMSAINTTPLVDVMLVLLIIFLITIPVVVQTVPVDLPTITNQALVTKPENITIAVDKDGRIFWNERQVPDMVSLVEKVKSVAVLDPQPEIHVRGDIETRYEYVGRVIVAVQKGGIVKVGFITQPELGGG